MSIERLPPETVERIAAGEVVTRPDAAVKELIENALDAGAGRIEVEVAGDGTDLLRVADDGCGMSRKEATLAVRRHTTSKLDGRGDLRGIETLGFRGEALAAIADAGRLELTTNDGDGPGTRVRVVGDAGEREVAASEAGRGRGTTVAVRDLFHDRPARRKSLAAASREFGRVADAVSAYALVRPDVRFRLSHDGQDAFSTPGSGDYADAALGVYDREVAGQSTAFEHAASLGGIGTDGIGGEGRATPAPASDVGGAAGAATGAEGADVAVEGRLCYPSITRSTRDHVTVAINGRVVANDAVRRAVAAGYGSLLPDGRHPVAAISVSVPPVAVDANVHPAKREVALTDGDAVADAVEAGVRDALETADLRRSADVAADLDSSLSALGAEGAVGDPGEGDGTGSHISERAADSRLADAEVVGQFRDLYLLCEAGDELLVVDQHAAHERINYERLRAALADEAVESRAVDPPATVSLSPADVATVEAHREALSELGFAVEPFGGGTVRVTAVPAPLGRAAAPESIREPVEALTAGGDPDDVRDDLLADLACHPSLKAGDALDGEDAAALLDRLATCEQPFACPHGRPTVLTIDEATFARGFERSGTRLG